ncbi:MAG TPA: DUF167 domain-containing protein [Acidimicrobiales bacterium]
MSRDRFDELFEIDGDSVVLRVHVQPGSARAAVTGRHGDALKVKVAAPPLEGRANQAVAALLATTFGIKAGAVELVSGATSRSKRFRLTGIDEAAARAGIERALAPAAPLKARRGGA